jgi:hypothetical protein
MTIKFREHIAMHCIRKEFLLLPSLGSANITGVYIGWFAVGVWY